jgi:hypothetical protein
MKGNSAQLIKIANLQQTSIHATFCLSPPFPKEKKIAENEFDFKSKFVKQTFCSCFLIRAL